MADERATPDSVSDSSPRFTEGDEMAGTIAVCPRCGRDVSEWSLFDYIDHLTYDHVSHYGDDDDD